MALFGNSNKKAKKQAEKLLKNLEEQGLSVKNYETRKSCYNCVYFTSLGNCNYHNRMTQRWLLCSNYWGK